MSTEIALYRYIIHIIIEFRLDFPINPVRKNFNLFPDIQTLFDASVEHTVEKGTVCNPFPQTTNLQQMTWKTSSDDKNLKNLHKR